MQPPFIEDKIAQVSRLRKVLILVVLILVLILVAGGSYYVWMLRGRDEKLKIEKRGVYSYVLSEEVDEGRFISGVIKRMGELGDPPYLELEVENSNKTLRVDIPPDVGIYLWTENGTVVRRSDRRELKTGLKILISRITEKGEIEIEAERITILQ